MTLDEVKKLKPGRKVKFETNTARAGLVSGTGKFVQITNEESRSGAYVEITDDATQKSRSVRPTAITLA